MMPVVRVTSDLTLQQAARLLVEGGAGTLVLDDDALCEVTEDDVVRAIADGASQLFTSTSLRMRCGLRAA